MLGPLAVVLLIVGIFGGGYLYVRYRFDQIKKISVGTETAYNGGPINVLVIGLGLARRTLGRPVRPGGLCRRCRRPAQRRRHDLAHRSGHAPDHDPLDTA